MAMCEQGCVWGCLFVWEKSQPYMFCWLIYHQALTLKLSQAVIEKVLNPVEIFYYECYIFYKLLCVRLGLFICENSDVPITDFFVTYWGSLEAKEKYAYLSITAQKEKFISIF